MYQIIDDNGNRYFLHTYEKESDFERMIVGDWESIFGKDGIYFDIKKLIGTPKKGAAVPDGYYLDLTFHEDPRLYLVEIELNRHDVYRHIGEQLLRFGISSETDKYRIKNILLQSIQTDVAKTEAIQKFFSKSKYNNSNELLDKVIFDNRPAAIIIIDEATEELSHVVAQLTMPIEIIEAQTYICGNKKLHRFTPFKDDVFTGIPETEDVDELDTIVVPAREDGFIDEFLHHERWFAIRISSAMIDKIKYIAAYQTAPVSGITHLAQVERIEKYKDTNKYMVLFKPGSLQKIPKIGLGKRKKGIAPQAPRYTSYKVLMKAKTLDEIWK